MLPNKGGITHASNIPDHGKVKQFRRGDILVSNIRPYFKKIWQASFDGACSSDVLVLTPKHCNPDYLYWTLSDNRFFSHAAAISKGTKMPRGDKDAIMDYQIPNFSSDEQHVICLLLNPIREKLLLNNHINDYLAA